MKLSSMLLITALFGFSQTVMPQDNCINHSQYQNTIANLSQSGSLVYNEAGYSLYPLFRWPMQNDIASMNIILHNYVDHNSSSGVSDYSNGTHSYNGHDGTDISVHYFREMDRGVPVYAAAPGTVMETHYLKYDRRLNGGEGTGGNYVLIKHNDNTYAYYYHLKKNSVTVEVGETVPEGRIIGYTGSSGNTDFPHLHFEPGQFVVNEGWVARDPFSGINNPFLSLWQNQQPYAGNSLRIFDLRVYVSKSVNNNSNLNTTGRLWKEGLQSPVTVGLNENKIGFFMLFQNDEFENIRVEVKKPDGTTYDQVNFQLGAHCSFCYVTPVIDFTAANVTGLWYVRVLKITGQLAVEQKRTYFQVGASTIMNPRFYTTPSGVYSQNSSDNLDEQQAGRVFRKSIFVQRDTLRVRKYGQAFNPLYYLVSAPANVSLINDSIISIGASWDQPFRIANFKAVAISTYNGTIIRDTAFYTLIDPGKPHGIQTGIEPVSGTMPGAFSLSQNYPNPFNPVTKIGFSVPGAGNVKLTVYDITGRIVAVLVNQHLSAGKYRADFDASEFSSGAYFYRIEAGEFTDVKKMVLLK